MLNYQRVIYGLDGFWWALKVVIALGRVLVILVLGCPLDAPRRTQLTCYAKKCLEIPKRETNVSTRGMWIYDYL